MKTATLDAPSAPAVTQSPAVVQAAPIIIKPLESIRAQFKFGTDGSVQFIKGAQVNPDELALLVTSECDSHAGAVERTVNLIRMARALPKVGEVSAFDYACAKVEADCATKATWHGVRALIEYADIRDVNSLTGSVYIVKEWTSYARKMGLLDGQGKLSAEAKADPVLQLAYKGEAKVNAIRPVLSTAKAKANAEDKAAGRPARFPTRATAADAAKSAVSKVSEITPAIVLHSMANARFGITKICETGGAAELKKAMLADDATKAILAFLTAK